MRIAFFTDDYLPYMHGVITSMQSYRAALEALGHEVYVVAPKPTDSNYKDHDDKVIRIRSFNSRVFEDRPFSLLYPGMARQFDKYQFDIIHSHTQFYAGFLAHLVAKRQKIPHVSTMHTLFTELSDDYQNAIVAGLIAVSIAYPIAFKTKPVIPFKSLSRETFATSWRVLMKKQGWQLINVFFNHTSHTIVPSRHVHRTLLAHGLKTPSTILPNGIDLTKFSKGKEAKSGVPIPKKPGDIWIIATGRLSAEKRPEVLVEAMAQLADLPVKLIVIGDGPSLPELKAFAKKLRITKNIHFTGMLSRSEVATWTSNGDIATIASHGFDNQPMVILESIAAGLPVVYCDANLQEGLTSSNAILTDTIDASGFATAFRRLATDAQLLSAMSEASLIQSRQFDIMKLAKKLVDIYLASVPVASPTVGSRLRGKIGADSWT